MIDEKKRDEGGKSLSKGGQGIDVGGGTSQRGCIRVTLKTEVNEKGGGGGGRPSRTINTSTTCEMEKRGTQELEGPLEGKTVGGLGKKSLPDEIGGWGISVSERKR